MGWGRSESANARKRERVCFSVCVILCCMCKCVCACARVYVVILQQLLGFNLVSFVNMFAIYSDFVPLSPNSTPLSLLPETSSPTKCAHASRSMFLRLSCTLCLSRSTGLFSPSHSVSPPLIPCYVSWRISLCPLSLPTFSLSLCLSVTSDLPMSNCSTL